MPGDCGMRDDSVIPEAGKPKNLWKAFCTGLACIGLTGIFWEAVQDGIPSGVGGLSGGD